MIRKVFTGESDKFLVIIGPCSADNEDAVLDYVHRLARVQEKVSDKLILIPRIYTNKPRTTGEGYKGMVHQPDPEKKPDMLAGILAIRHMHMRAVAETGLFDHVTAMVSTTGPTLVIALILYTILGLNVDTSAYDPAVAQSIQDAFRGSFNISPVLLIPIIVVIVMCVLRVPGLVGIAASVATATIFMIIFQSTDIYGSRALGDIFNTLHYGIGVETGNEVADSILGKAGGMDGTMWTINLILVALAYGGALERCGCIEKIFGGLKHKIHSVGSLILATLLTSIFCDATMCDQFLGIGVPAPIYADKYDELGLGRNMLSRSLEDAGTLWAVMFPWTGCGAYQTGVLGMSPLVFFPYAFVNLLNPVYAYVTAAFGRNIFWADGSYTNIFGKTKAGKPAGAPEEAHAKAVANLEALRAAGKAPKISA